LTIEITNKDFSVTEIVEKMKSTDVGCVVSFVGTVRGTSSEGSVETLLVEAYIEMAKKELLKLANDARKNFAIEDVSIIHRIGELKVSENIICIAVSASHRENAFRACKWLIDELKKSVPIWKTEIIR